ncbi:glycosyltransferase family 2 protein [Candidatus Electrothrix sp.]|uniref:glycosyltransferase family 2 protein n=1 Tax=Candidatus Electrothrix sp. TaxID=2170559 RepID=UPI004056AEF3
MRIISLSIIPPRFPFLKASLETLLAQRAADEIRLYIPRKYRRFPDYDGSLPEVPKGVIICQIDEDYGPATKVLPASRDFRGQDVQILFCDDDGLFPPGWAKRLFDIQAKRKSQAIATLGRRVTKDAPKPGWPCARQILHKHDLQYRFGRFLEKNVGFDKPLFRPIIIPGYVDILFGVCGVVVRPEFFDDEAFNIPDEAWFVDDFWLSAQLARNGVRIYCPWRLPCPRSSEAGAQEALLDLELAGAGRQALNQKATVFCQKKYGIWGEA